jgi:hypothetical protein
MPNPAVSPKQIFDHAHEIESLTERNAYLDQACAESPELRQKVEGLLRAYEEMDSDFLTGANRPVSINVDQTGAYTPADETPEHSADTPHSERPADTSHAEDRRPASPHDEHDDWVGRQIGP